MADLRGAFDRAAGANRELVDGLDDALVEAGRTLAERVDEGAAAGDAAVLYLVPHLMNVLREMYATPKARKEAGLEVEAARGKLADIRDIRKRPAPSKKRTTG